MPGNQSNGDPEFIVPEEALGKSLDHFPLANYQLKRWLPLIVGGLFILTSIILILILIIETSTQIAFHGRAIILGIFTLPTVLYVLLFFAGILLIHLAVRHWHDGIQLYEAGLSQQTAKREKTWLFDATQRFDSFITQVMFGGSIVSTRIKIIFEDGSDNHFIIRNRYDRMLALIEAVRERVVPDLIERAHRRLLNGETLYFHENLQADSLGLLINGQVTAYDQVESRINNQVIKLHQKDNPKAILFKSAITQIRNFDVLLNLLENPLKSENQSSPK